MGQPSTRLPAMTSVLLVSLYFSQGFPAGLSVHVLPPIFRQAGIDLAWIGFLKLLALPWLLKFLWAPVVDSRSPRQLLGRSHPSASDCQRRRAWLLWMQGLAIVWLVLLSFFDPSANQWFIGIAALVLLLNLTAATQDIATDGLAVSLLPPERRGWGNALQVGGYKIGLVLASSLLLVSIDFLGWQTSLWLMAAGLLLCTLPVWRGPLTKDTGSQETLTIPEDQVPVASSPATETWWATYRGLLGVKGIVPWLLIVSVYKVGDALVSPMLKPMLVDQGLALSEIGGLTGIASLVGTMAVFAAAGAYQWLGLWRSLLGFGVLHGASLIALVAVLETPYSSGLLWLLILEQVTDAMATVALFAGMMSWCRLHHEGTDYTLQACLQVFITGLAAVGSGFLAKSMGYEGLLLLAGSLGAIVAVVAAFWVRARG